MSAFGGKADIAHNGLCGYAGLAHTFKFSPRNFLLTASVSEGVGLSKFEMNLRGVIAPPS